VTAVSRRADGVDVTLDGGVPQTFDRVVIATHADQALDLLADATPDEKEDLGAIRYSVNRTWLHSDSSVLPRRPAARASWNYSTTCTGPTARGVVVSYWMNRLQGLEDTRDYVVTLNPEGSVDESTVIAEMTYTHPVFTAAAVEAASRLSLAGGDRLAFAGAHLGWGFHDDGCRSGVEAAARFGATW
jgi:predicted NAD/FAD-binding protein